MAKVKLNPIVEEVSGGLGNLVFRSSNGKRTASASARQWPMAAR